MTENDARKIRWAKLSVVSNAALVAFKLVVGVLAGSMAIIAEAVHSANDLLAAAIAYGAVRKAAEPPDADHAFGHGKFENLSGLLEAALIVAAGGVIIHQSAGKIANPGEVRFLDLGIAVMILSAAVNFFVARKLAEVARETDSIAIETDAAHLMVDVYTSLGVGAGLLAIRLTGLHVLDPAISIAVALYIIWLGVRLSWKAGSDLLDRQLPQAEVEEIERTIADRSHSIASFHKLATRKSGGTRMIDVHIQVHGAASVRDSHELASHIEHDICAKYPGARVLTHIEPCDDRCEACGVPGCPDDRKKV
jgi:cation diffusion facilitator family transporter